MNPKNWHTSHNLVGTEIALMTSTLDAMGLNSSLLKQKPRYSVSVHPNNHFYAFTFNPSFTSFCKTFLSSFIWSTGLLLAMSSILSVYKCTISNPSKSYDIFYWGILGILQTSIGIFWYYYSAQGSTIVQIFLNPGDN